MKIDKKYLLIITFTIALAILLLVFFLMTGFSSGIKDIISAVYFAIWIAAAMGMWLYGIQPYLQGRKKAKGDKKTQQVVHKTASVPSPKSDLPLRDRIREYVTERRKEEGLPVPEPLVPSKTGGTPSKAKVQAAGIAGAAMGVAAAATAGSDTGGDLPLPDDFDATGEGDIFGEETGGEPGLPGLGDEDLGSFDEGGEPGLPGHGDEDLGSFDEGGEPGLPGLGDEDLGSLDEGGEPGLPGHGDEDLGSFEESGDEMSPDAGSDALPDFDGDLEPEMAESDLTGSIDDFSDEESTPSDTIVEDNGGGLSEDGLSDIELPLSEDMMDDDMSEDNEFLDIEFDDIEPDEM
ncbi:MAG: hypothetical protein GXY48_09395 [Methanomicrobiales archaeon]|nr:hypothetical protein [Methanomicrobiales archaeon]